MASMALKSLVLATLMMAAVMALAGSARPSVFVQVHLRSATTPEAQVEAEFYARATPGSKVFRQHLTQAELVKMVGASDAALAAATRFLRANGGESIQVLSTRDVVSAVVPPTARLAAFGLEAADFTKPEGFRRVLSVAADAGLVDLYHVIVNVGNKKAAAKQQQAKGAAQFPGMEITPQAIFNRYKAPSTPAQAPAGFSQGVAEFQQSHFRQSDIKTFSENYNLPVPTVNVVGPNVVGSQDDVEGTLDVEYITAVSGGITTWWISQNTTNPDPNGLDFTWWAEEVLAISPQPPSVVSISWGMGEFYYNDAQAVLESDNRAFRKLGLRGVTVFAASGDSGPGARQYTSCKRFMPGWPASSPYVTTVGATYATSPESAETSVSFSGGGFSDVFPTPAYQQQAVNQYLTSASGLPATSFFNTSGRAYPDVAALGTNFRIFYPSSPYGSSVWGPVSGTSCASPTFAAVISRINAERVNAGKPTLGFLNPAIYQLGRVGQDVQSGQSIDQDCYGIFNIKGFPAAQGWDAVSGLGTPDYQFLSSNL